jgi:hypothetical protein
MNVFLSWSGSKSQSVALLLQKYLPSIIQSVRPWLSSNDVSAGARWSPEIAANLESSNVGIICLTPDNLNAPWILFEAGAISKLTSAGRAMVLRIGLSPTEITGPLSQFQSVSTNREGIWKLITDINKAGVSALPESALELCFDGLWGKMEAELQKILDEPTVARVPKRSLEDMLGELLELARRQDLALRTIGNSANHIMLSDLGDEDNAKLNELFLWSTNPGRSKNLNNLWRLQISEALRKSSKRSEEITGKAPDDEDLSES